MNPAPTMPSTPEAAEPKAGLQAVPIWLLVSVLVMIYWGMVYFDQNGGWFSQQVYAPYNSVEEVGGWWPTDEGGAVLAKGQLLFKNNCAVCHMETGVGNPANGCPPLIASEWVAAEGPNRLIRLVSKGGGGPIEVGGKSYTGTMLPIGDQLPGDEKEKSESIAAILTYVRKNFGKVSKPVTPEEVAHVREGIKGHSAPYTSAELLTTSPTE
jgi:mono/diheme cytochrome c family protein